MASAQLKVDGFGAKVKRRQTQNLKMKHLLNAHILWNI